MSVFVDQTDLAQGGKHLVHMAWAERFRQEFLGLFRHLLHREFVVTVLQVRDDGQ